MKDRLVIFATLLLEVTILLVTLLMAAMVLSAAFFAVDRVDRAAKQCLIPPFVHSFQCFVHDALTGEDL